MADIPHTQAVRPRPLSPHLQIYRLSVTMVTSITHRITGVALYGGTVLIAWWLIAASLGLEAYQPFVNAAANPVGQLVLFGFTWALAYHFWNGIRHLAWDVGYGFVPRTAMWTGVLVVVLSVITAVAAFAFAYAEQVGASS